MTIEDEPRERFVKLEALCSFTMPDQSMIGMDDDAGGLVSVQQFA